MLKKAISHLGIFLLSIISYLPFSVLYLIADVVYLLLYYVVGYRKKVVRENLKNALPERSPEELRKIEKVFFRYLASLMLEVVKTNSISRKELQKRFIITNKHLIEDYLKQGRGVLVCSAHYGNWEWGTLAFGASLSATLYPIYKPLANQVFDNWFMKMRSKFGNRMTAMRHTLRVLKETENIPSVMAFGNDQSPRGKDVQYWTTFLNQPSSIQLGIEKIAIKTDRPVFYMKVKYLKRGYYEVDCVPLCLNPKETAEFEITELHTKFLEQIIKEEPAYWLWSHRRWKHQPKVSSSYATEVV